MLMMWNLDNILWQLIVHNFYVRLGILRCAQVCIIAELISGSQALFNALFHAFIFLNTLVIVSL